MIGVQTCALPIYALIFVVLFPGVWDESEDFGRDLVDWSECVLHGPNETEDFRSLLFENIDLEWDID